MLATTPEPPQQEPLPLLRFVAPKGGGLARLLALPFGDAIVNGDLTAGPGLSIRGASFQEAIDPDYRWDGLHPSHGAIAVIRYTVAGRGKLQLEDREMIVEPGQLLLLHCPHDYRCSLSPGHRWTFFDVVLVGNEGVRCMQEVVARLGPVLPLDGRKDIADHAAEVCADVLENKIASPFRAAEMAHALMMELLAAAAVDSENSWTEPRQVPQFVTDVEQFCRMNLARPIGVEDMARVAGMSRFHFSRRFEKLRGIPPGRYLAHLRLEEAMRLVVAGGIKVKDVASRSGFGDANYFCKVFRKHFGISPGAVMNGGRRGT